VFSKALTEFKSTQLQKQVTEQLELLVDTKASTVSVFSPHFSASQPEIDGQVIK